MPASSRVAQAMRPSSPSVPRSLVKHRKVLRLHGHASPCRQACVVNHNRRTRPLPPPFVVQSAQAPENRIDDKNSVPYLGQIDSALVCYQKSALLIEKNSESERVINQGYIRRWIGELLLARGENERAGLFLRAAKLKWEQVSPPKAAQVSDVLLQLGSQIPDVSNLSNQAIERECLDRIAGRS